MGREMDKAWSNSLTALVRQLYHSSKASVKQYPPRALHDGILGARAPTGGTVRRLEGAISTSPHHSAGECFERRRASGATSRRRRYWPIPRLKLLWQCRVAFVPRAAGGTPRRRGTEWDPAQPAVRLKSILGLLLRGTRSSRGSHRFAFRLPHRQRGKHSPSGPASRSERWHPRSRGSSMHRPTERRGGKRS
jgi:hypothetical protein